MINRLLIQKEPILINLDDVADDVTDDVYRAYSDPLKEENLLFNKVLKLGECTLLVQFLLLVFVFVLVLPVSKQFMDET